MIDSFFNNTSNTEDTIAEEVYTDNSEKDLFGRLSEPLPKLETDETGTTNDTEISEEEAPQELTSEHKKRLSRLNSLGAKGIVKAVDIGVANIAARIACSDEVVEYRADPEAIEDLTVIVSEAIPNIEDPSKLKMPLWAQILIFSLIAFAPVLFAAWSDRKKNKEIYDQRKQLRRYKMEIKKLKMQKEALEMQKELKSEEQEQFEETKEQTEE